MTTKFAVIVLGTLSVILVGMIGVVVYLNHLSKNPKQSITTQLPTPTTQKAKAFVFLEPVFIQNAGNPPELQFWLSPQKDTVNLSTLAIQITLKSTKGNLIPQSSNATLGDDFKSTGWTTPFNNLTHNSNGSIDLKLSLVYATPEPYPITGKVMLASLPLPKGLVMQDLSVVVDPTVSKVFDKSNNEYQFAGAGQPLTISSEKPQP